MYTKVANHKCFFLPTNPLWGVQYVPGKMMHHFSWFHHFLKPIHHFTGASFFRVTLLLFGSPSFYRNIILLEQLCPPNLSPSFYDSTLKKINIVHHFTGSLPIHEPDILEGVVAPPPPVTPVILPPLFSWIRARNYSTYAYSWVVAEISPTHTTWHCMSLYFTTLNFKRHPSLTF